MAIFDAPQGKTVDDPDWSKKVADDLNKFKADHPDQVLDWAGYLRAITASNPDAAKAAQENAYLRGTATKDKTRTFVNISLKGDNDDTILNNYKSIEADLKNVNDGNIELAGLQPLANELTGTIAKDQQRAEVLALPLVAVVLFFVFGGVVAAVLPVMVGGLSIAGALGIMRTIAEINGPVHYFAQPVVTLIGLGIAIDYGLFVVSRFREELAEGYDTEAAVRRTMMTAGRTVTFSAVLIVASLAGLLLFPQGFLKSLTYAGIASVMLSAILSITVLPACLAVLGKHVDALGVRTLLRVPLFRNVRWINAYLNWLADRLQKTKTREEVENGFWGKLINVVTKRPILFAAPILIMMILLIVPLGQLTLGGISEKYLPPDNPVRQAQEDFDRTFPGYRTETLALVIQNADPAQVDEIKSEAGRISGFTNPSWQERTVSTDSNGNPGTKTDPNVTVLENGLQIRNDAPNKISQLRSIQTPKGVTVWVGGTPALEQDSIHSLFAKLPLMGRDPDHDDNAADVPGVRVAGAAHQGGRHERADAGIDARHLDVDLRRRAFLAVAEFHRDTADRPRHRADHRGGLRPVHRLRGVPRVPNGRSQRAWHVHDRGDSDRHRHHGPHHHRGGVDPRDRRGRVRVLRPRDDEVPGVRPDRGTAVGRHGGPDVPGAIDHEAARRRLLVGTALDEAAAEPYRAGRDPSARRAQAARGS